MYIISKDTPPTVCVKFSFGVFTGGTAATEEELRTDELDAVLELDLSEEDDVALDEDEVCALELLEPRDEVEELEEVATSAEEVAPPEEEAASADEADAPDEDESSCVSALLKPSSELDDASCPESEESGSVLELLSSLSCSEEELNSPCTGGEEEETSEIEDDESIFPPLFGSSMGFSLLHVIRKNTRAAIAGITPRFIIRFINTSRWQYG
jgi:hypothetical protein